MIKHPIVQAVVFFGYFIVSSLITVMITNDLIHLFMVWNLFLGLLVFSIAYFSNNQILQKQHPIVFILYLLIWLIMLPNMFYFITDLLHLTSYDFYVNVGYMSFTFKQDIAMYMALFNLFTGALISLYYGYQSIEMVYQALEHKAININYIIFVILLSMLSSIGIVIGRFLRFNSWEILKFWKIMGSLFNQWNLFYTQFVMLFFLLHLFIILGFRYITSQKGVV